MILYNYIIFRRNVLEFARFLDEAYQNQLFCGKQTGELTNCFVNDGRVVKLDKNFNALLFAQLKQDVANGILFPAIRANELHFYYKGGCLYKFAKGRFVRDARYALYGEKTDDLPPYEQAKRQNEIKFTNVGGEQKERQLLDKLYCHTYSQKESRVVVLDIEVNLNGDVQNGKKCDLVLLNKQTRQIMFAEGKVFSDRRVKCAPKRTPPVIDQVKGYTAAVAEQRQNILSQYRNYVKIANSLFGTTLCAPQSLIEPVKLLVYQTGGCKPSNMAHTICTIQQELGANNVYFVAEGEPTLEKIWDMLSN